MKKPNSNDALNRLDFIAGSLGLGTFLGLGCPGLLSLTQDQNGGQEQQRKHKFETATGFSYRQLFVLPILRLPNNLIRASNSPGINA